MSGRRIRCTTSLTEDDLRAIPGVTEVHFDRDNAELVVTTAESVTRELLFSDATLSNLEVSGIQLEEAFLALTNAKEAA